MALIGVRQIIDVDVWWHIQLGHDMLTHFGAPDFSKFYFTPINPEILDLRYTWLGDIIFYLTYLAGGTVGLQLLRMTLMAWCAWMLWDINQRRLSAALFTLLIVFFLTTYQIQLMRNALFSMPFMTALYWFWWKYTVKNRTKFLWMIPALLFIWSCIHGTYMLGCVLFCCLIGGNIYSFFWRNRNVEPPKKRKKNQKPDKTDMNASLLEELLTARSQITALFLAFLLVLFYNQAAINELSRLLGSFWWMWITAGFGLLAAVFFTPQVPQWLIAKRALVFKTIRAGLFLFVASCVVLLSYKVIQTHQAESVLVKAQNGSHSGWLKSTAKVFNSLVVKADDRVMVSQDFLSPWFHLHEMYISLSFLVGLVTLVVFIIRRPVPTDILFTFFPVMILAFGYKRTAGFLGMVSVFSILLIGKRKILEYDRLWLWLCNGVFFSGLALSLFLFPQKIGIWEKHIPGWGRAPLFSTQCADEVLLKEGDNPVFTTITNGGFLLFHWYPEKRVFVDSFFAPHSGETFNQFKSILLSDDPDLLFRKFGIYRAIVCHQDLVWMNVFSSSQNWYPESMDEGVMVFLYESDWDKAPQPTLYLDDFDDQPEYNKTLVSNRVLEIPSILIAKGRLTQALNFMKEEQALIHKAHRFADPFSVEQLKKNIQTAQAEYNGNNSKILYLKSVLQRKIIEKKPEAIVAVAGEIWDQKPTTEIGLQLSDSLISTGQLDRAKEILTKTEELDRSEDRKVRKNTISLWNKLAEKALQSKELLLGFTSLHRIHTLDNEKLTRTQLKQISFKLYLEHGMDKNIHQRYRYLLKLREVFNHEPAVLHHLSVLVLKNYSELGLSLADARSFSEQALELCELQSVEKNHPYVIQLSRVLEAGGQKAELEKILKKYGMEKQSLEGNNEQP